MQIIAYEWRQALGGYAVEPRTATAEVADAAAVQGALEHWRQALEHLGFLDPDAPRKLMPRLNQLLNRAAPSTQEVHILRGIARVLLSHSPPDRQPASAPPPSLSTSPTPKPEDTINE